MSSQGPEPARDEQTEQEVADYARRVIRMRDGRIIGDTGAVGAARPPTASAAAEEVPR